MTTTYWPWWLSAIGLAGTAIVYLVVVRRALGFSGALGTMLSRTARSSETDAAAVDPAALDAALLEVTRRRFGAGVADGQEHSADADGDHHRRAPPLSWSRSVLFVAGSIVGGAVFALVAQAPVETAPAGLYEHLYGKAAWAALFGGGVLVGFGTSMAGGCTSGHGLVGCSRLQVPSFLATACFFGVAIALGLVVKGLGWAP